MNQTNLEVKNISYKTFDADGLQKSSFSKDDIADFLFKHLDQYGDERKYIMKCLDYALSTEPGKGGFVELAHDGNKIVGAVVINYTGMAGYIPENILVYIAVNKEYRGHGIGKKLMEQTIAHTKGAVALHVEPDNPAKFLYEKYGFANKYLEMRLQK
ncbi:MAG TPA: GNAT family N-acetyltransferase [Balneolales bacterium]|jgi:ribosomal protein S18 acetylase RimI-like enzyme|nr:GNAT family N-acetyltransferase [Balneolales bacterium]